MDASTGEPARVSLAELGEQEREEALRRWRILRPHVENGCPLTRAAADGGVPVRTAQRWLARYRADGLAGLARQGRSDRGRRRFPDELVALIEGLALRRPRPTVATVARQAAQAATTKGWPVPSYGTVYAIVAGLDPHLIPLAHTGPARTRCAPPRSPIKAVPIPLT